MSTSSKKSFSLNLKTAAPSASSHSATAESFIKSKQCSFDLPNSLLLNRSVIDYILQFCTSNGMSATMGFRLRVALEEAFSNAVTHGNLEMDSKEFKEDGDFAVWKEAFSERMNDQEMSARRVHVGVEIELNKQVKITVEDDGEGFDYKKIMRKLSPEDPYQFFGRGLLMICSVADRLRFSKNGSRIAMTFHF